MSFVGISRRFDGMSWKNDLELSGYTRAEFSLMNVLEVLHSEV